MNVPLSRLAAIVGGVLWLLAMGFLIAWAEGFIPKNLRQVLLVVFVIGPLLLVAEPIIEFVMQVVCYGIARVLLPILTFGAMRAEHFGESYSYPWYGFTRDGEQKWVASADAASIIGLLIVGAIVGVCIYVFAVL